MAGARSPRRDGHSSGAPVAGRLEQPTRATGPTDTGPATPEGEARRSYSVLLPAGLAVPPTLPPARCALTAPFHPCRRSGPRGPLSGGLLSVALSLGSPPPDVIRRRIRMEPGLSSAIRGGRPADWPCRNRPAPGAEQGQSRSPPESRDPSVSPGRAVHCGFTQFMGLSKQAGSCPPARARGRDCGIERKRNSPPLLGGRDRSCII